MMSSILFEVCLMIAGLIVLGPEAINEMHEPMLFPLWLEWAEQHQDNDFREISYDRTYNHPKNWYDEEFCFWLEVQGIYPHAEESYHQVNELHEYLTRYRYVKRKTYYHHWVYQINKNRLY